MLSGKILTKTTNVQTTSISLLLTFAPQGAELLPTKVKGQRYNIGNLVSFILETIEKDSHQGFTGNALNYFKQGNKTKIELNSCGTPLVEHLFMIGRA